MAEAKKSQKPPISKIGKVFEDTDYDLKTYYNGYYVQQGANLGSGTFEDAWEAICAREGLLLSHLAYSQTWPHAWSLLAQAIPAATGVSLFMLPTASYQTYSIPLYDQTYPRNPAFNNPDATLTAPKDFTGLMAYGWNNVEMVTQEDLTQEKKTVQNNDNNLLFKLINYSKDGKPPTTQEELKTLKFSFGVNKYKVVRSQFKSYEQLYLLAEGQQECMMIFKCPEGIIGFNWATSEYKGDRMQVGSLKGYGSNVQNFYNELVERELITGEKWE